MRFWRLLIFAALINQCLIVLPAKAIPTHFPRQNYLQLTVANIDQINNTVTNIYLSNPIYARKLAGDALVYSRIINYKKGICESFLNIGITYWSQSYYPISLLYVDTALTYAQNHKELISDCYRYIGRDYTDLKDYKSAALFLNKAQIAAGVDLHRIKKLYAEQAYLAIRQNQLDTALYYANKGLNIQNVKDENIDGILYNRLADVYMDKNEPKKALNYCNTGLLLSLKVNNKRLRTSVFIAKAQILIDQGKIAEGLGYAKQARLLSDSLGVMDMSAGAYKMLIYGYDLLKDKDQSLFYQKEYNTFLEKRYQADRQNSSQLMHDYFDLNGKMQDVSLIRRNSELNNLQIKDQQRTILILIIFLLLVGVALYIVSFYYRQKKQLAEQLEEQHIATLAQSQIIEAQAHRLEDLNHFKTRLLAVIGHDLRAPINNLYDIIELFEDGSFSEEEVTSLMKSISPVVKSAELTLSNLLLWADGQIRGVNTQQKVPVGILAIVEEAEEIFSYSLTKKSIKISYDIDPDSLVMADESQLKVIVGNIISNAIKFTPDAGRITITLEQDDDMTVIMISDTGIGMSADEMDKLMSAKKHFSKPGTMGEKGTGIGLLLCRELIELNGGKLWISSQIGEGTTFNFSLFTANTAKYNDVLA